MLTGLCVRLGQRLGGIPTAELELLLRMAGASVEAAEPGSAPMSIATTSDAICDAKSMMHVPTDQEDVLAAIVAGVPFKPPPARGLPPQSNDAAGVVNKAILNESEGVARTALGAAEAAKATLPRLKQTASESTSARLASTSCESAQGARPREVDGSTFESNQAALGNRRAKRRCRHLSVMPELNLAAHPGS